MHMPFEGTITLSPETFMRVVTETCVSTAQHGARKLMIVNWHEGNIPSLAIAAEDLHRKHGMAVVIVQACYVAAELYGDECNGLTHGGEIEALVLPVPAARGSGAEAGTLVPVLEARVVRLPAGRRGPEDPGL